MRTIINRESVSFALVFITLWWARTSLAQDGPDESERVVRGFESCYKCHDRNTSPRVLPGGRVVRGDDWILGRECGIWAEHDQHVQAFSVLLNERSREMAKIMGVVDGEGNSQLHRDFRCLACHTGYPLRQIPRDESNSGLCSPKALKILDLNQGVSCEGCHGPSGTGSKPGWFDPHAKADSRFEANGQQLVWRYLSPQAKLDDFGYVDVRSPFERTRMCASCHIGDARSGRVVTHAMYAAGHPPLPAFEVESFLDQMPRHWRSIQEKAQIDGGALVDDFIARTQDPAFSRFQSATSPSSAYRQNFERTRAMVIGQLSIFHQHMELLADLARPEGSFNKVEVPQPAWPDLASFDCFACHHELRYPGWRQTLAKGRTKPGRPKIHQWPSAFVRFMAKDDEKLATLLSDVDAAVTARPFADTRRLVSVCDNAAEWAKRAAKEKSAFKFDQSTAKQLRRDISDYGSTASLDYDSARAMLWVFFVVDDELRSHRLGSDPRELSTVDDAPRNYRTNLLSEPLKRFASSLNLDMRKRDRERLNDTSDLLGDEQRREIGSTPLEEILPLIDDYDPEVFRKAFGSLRGTP